MFYFIRLIRIWFDCQFGIDSEAHCTPPGVNEKTDRVARICHRSQRFCCLIDCLHVITILHDPRAVQILYM